VSSRIDVADYFALLAFPRRPWGLFGAAEAFGLIADVVAPLQRVRHVLQRREPYFLSLSVVRGLDYPTAKDLQAVAADVWDRGVVVGAVCHGPVIMPGIVDSKNGKSIIHGKTVTGFTIEGNIPNPRQVESGWRCSGR
jgi:hypothetical protein